MSSLLEGVGFALAGAGVLFWGMRVGTRHERQRWMSHCAWIAADPHFNHRGFLEGAAKHGLAPPPP